MSRLLIGNLSLEAHESELEELFSGAGLVQSVELISDPLTGRKKGFAFVQMTSRAEASRAKELFDGVDFNGRRINVNTSSSLMEPSKSSFVDRIFKLLRWCVNHIFNSSVTVD